MMCLARSKCKECGTQHFGCCKFHVVPTMLGLRCETVGLYNESKEIAHPARRY